MPRRIIPSILVPVLVTATASASDLDALALARTTVATSIPLQWEDEDLGLGSGIFVRSGVNVLSNVEIGSASFSVGANRGLDGTGLPPDFDTPLAGGTLRDLSLRIGTGFDLEIGLALRVADDITIEIATGVQWNPVSSATGTLDYVTTEPDGMGGTNDVLWTSAAVGGSGDLWQVPITIGLLYDAEIADDLRLSIGGGGGLEWSVLGTNGIRSATYAGAIVQDAFGNDTVVPLVFDLDGEGIALRYQFMVALSYQVFPGGFLGGYVRYAGTSLLDYGRFGFQESPNNIYRDSSDVEAGMLRNLSIGATFSISF